MTKLWYLASPYTKFKDGIDRAFVEASKNAAWLANKGIFTFAPIAHTHPIALYGNIDCYDYEIMLKWDFTFIDRCDGLIVCMMDGWDKSYGVSKEIEYCLSLHKPVYYMRPYNVPEEFGEWNK